MAKLVAGFISFIVVKVGILGLASDMGAVITDNQLYIALVVALVVFAMFPGNKRDTFRGEKL